MAINKQIETIEEAFQSFLESAKTDGEARKDFLNLITFNRCIGIQALANAILSDQFRFIDFFENHYNPKHNFLFSILQFRTDCLAKRYFSEFEIENFIVECERSLKEEDYYTLHGFLKDLFLDGISFDFIINFDKLFPNVNISDLISEFLKTGNRFLPCIKNLNKKLRI